MTDNDTIIKHRALRDALKECLELRVISEIINGEWEYEGKPIGLNSVKTTIQLIWKPTGEVITEAII